MALARSVLLFPRSPPCAALAAKLARQIRSSSSILLLHVAKCLPQMRSNDFATPFQKSVCEMPGMRTKVHLKAQRTSLVSSSSVFLTRAVTVVGVSPSCWAVCGVFPAPAVGGCHCSCCGGPPACGGGFVVPVAGGGGYGCCEGGGAGGAGG